jgi:hypothetical protein
MANFQIGTRVTTSESSVEVTVSPAAPIAPGIHHFQLVVVDEAGNQSDPATVGVIIKDTVKPTAVITAAPSQVDPGQNFRLDGSKSSDVPPGKIVNYIWTMID